MRVAPTGVAPQLPTSFIGQPAHDRAYTFRPDEIEQVTVSRTVGREAFYR